MIMSIVILFFLTFLDTSSVQSSKFRVIFSFVYWCIFIDFILLGWLGQKSVEDPYIETGKCATFLYYFYFILLIPIIGLLEKNLFTYNKK